MERLYLILDREGNALAQAHLESPPGSEVVQMRLLEEPDMDFTKLGELQLIALDVKATSKRGTVTMQRGDRLVIRPSAVLGAEARENLRILTDFQSFIYPITGYWKGQRPIKGKDLSCGGVAFYCEQKLGVGEVVQLVLPVTEAPVLLRTRVLRLLPSEGPEQLYAARFVELCMDEEMIIRKAVFSIQVSRPRPKKEQ